MYDIGVSCSTLSIDHTTLDSDFFHLYFELSRLVEAIQSSALDDLDAVDKSDVDRNQFSKRLKYHEKHAKEVVKKMTTKFSNNVIRYHEV